MTTSPTEYDGPWDMDNWKPAEIHWDEGVWVTFGGEWVRVGPIPLDAYSGIKAWIDPDGVFILEYEPRYG